MIKNTELKHFINTKLPGYMISSRIVQLDKLPLTPNRKLEKKLVEIWTNILHLGIENTMLVFLMLEVIRYSYLN